jgi:hypothetical protein
MRPVTTVAGPSLAGDVERRYTPGVKKFIALCALAICLTPLKGSDAKAIEIAKDMMTAMGGVDNWNRAHFLRYDFKVNRGGKMVADRSHLWDKMTGRYRLDGKSKEGKSTVTLFNVANQQGAAYVDGKKLEGQAAAEAIKSAYGAFINDMYWLAMPWKWLDAGVQLKYMGKKAHRGQQMDVVQLTFGKVGLTPGDSYEAFVSPKTKLMEHWKYKLQSGNTGDWDWEYTTTGGIKLASKHTNAAGDSINMGRVAVLDKLDESVFTDPGRPLP